jgi:hypothetical protein
LNQGSSVGFEHALLQALPHKLDPLDEVQPLCVGLLAAFFSLIDAFFKFLDQIKLVRDRPIGSSPHHTLNLCDIRGRQMRPINLDRQLVQFGRERERRRIILVVHTRERVRANVEALIPLQDHWQGFFHRLGGDGVAVNFKRAGAGATNAGEIVVRFWFEKAEVEMQVLEGA